MPQELFKEECNMGPGWLLLTELLARQGVIGAELVHQVNAMSGVGVGVLTQEKWHLQVL